MFKLKRKGRRKICCGKRYLKNDNLPEKFYGFLVNKL
jgi:hypothetical protein